MNKLKSCVLFLFFTLFFAAANGQEKQDQNSALQNAIANKHFVFDATMVMPTGGRTRQISNDRYQVRVNGDSLVSDLPYFGRVYTAPLDNEGGIHFTSTSFAYSYKPRKKGGWELLIQPKEATDLREFSLTVSDNGFATLRALSNNRQPITFTGNVHAIQQ